MTQATLAKCLAREYDSSMLRNMLRSEWREYKRVNRKIAALVDAIPLRAIMERDWKKGRGKVLFTKAIANPPKKRHK